MIFDFVQLPGRLPIVSPNYIVYLLFYLFLGHSTDLWGPLLPFESSKDVSRECEAEYKVLTSVRI